MRLDPDAISREAAKVAEGMDRGRGFSREIRGAVAIKLPRKDFVLMPAACIHWPLTDVSLLKEWIARVKARKAYVFMVGDSMDFARSHFRRHLGSYREDQSSMSAVDLAQMEDIKELARLLMPIKNQILGVVRGNHYHLFPDGTDSEQQLCQIREYFG